MHIPVLHLWVVGFVGFQLPITGDAECCRAGLRSIGVRAGASQVSPGGSLLCHDCTSPDPCCSIGRCNIFCCECADRCRWGCRASRSIGGWRRLLTNEHESRTGHDVIIEGDIDGDGKLSLAEAQHYVSKRSVHDAETRERMLMEMDIDNDNFFSTDEIDND